MADKHWTEGLNLKGMAKDKIPAYFKDVTASDLKQILVEWAKQNNSAAEKEEKNRVQDIVEEVLAETSKKTAEQQKIDGIKSIGEGVSAAAKKLNDYTQRINLRPETESEQKVKVLPETSAFKTAQNSAVNTYDPNNTVTQPNTPTKIPVPKKLEPVAKKLIENPTSIISNVVDLDRAKKLKEVKEKSSNILPKMAANDPSLPTAVNANRPAEQNFLVADTPIPSKPESTHYWDTISARWKNKETEKYAVSPTKAANKKLASVADSQVLAGSSIQHAAKFLLDRKEKKAREESIAEQENSPKGLRAAVTTMNQGKVENARDGSSSFTEEDKSEEMQDQKDRDEKIINLLEKIEKNTEKKDLDKKDKKEDKEKPTSLSGMKTLLTGLLSGVGAFFTGIKSILSKFPSIINGVIDVAKNIGSMVKNFADKFSNLKDKLMGNKKGTSAKKNAAAKTGGIETKVDKNGKEYHIDKSTGKRVSAEVAGKAGDVSGKGAGKVAGKAGDVSGKGAGKVAGKGAAKVGAKTAGKSLMKKIPGLGLLAAGAFAAGRLMDGDFRGAALEAASGALGSIPVVGTALSFGADAVLAKHDMNLGDEANSIVEKAQNTGSITKDEAIVLKTAGVEVPEGVKVLDETSAKVEPSKSDGITVKSAPVEATPKEKMASTTTPAEVSKIAQKMNVVDQNNTESKAIGVDNAKAMQPTMSMGSTNINNSGGKGGNSSPGGRIFARNPESTLEKWLASRYVWQ